MSNSLITNDEKIFFPEGKKIVVNGVECVVMPFVLKNRIKAVRIIVDILKAVMDSGTDMQNIKDVSALTNVILDHAGERLVEIYELAIDKPREWLESHVRLVDEVVIIEAIVEVNDIRFLADRVKALANSMKKVSEKS